MTALVRGVAVMTHNLNNWADRAERSEINKADVEMQTYLLDKELEYSKRNDWQNFEAEFEADATKKIGELSEGLSTRAGYEQFTGTSKLRMQMGKNAVFQKARKLEVAESISQLDESLQASGARIMEGSDLGKEVEVMNQLIETKIDAGHLTEVEGEDIRDKAGNGLVDILIKTKTSDHELEPLLKTLEGLRAAGLGSEVALSAAIEDTKEKIDYVGVKAIVAKDIEAGVPFHEQFEKSKDLYKDNPDLQKALRDEIATHKNLADTIESAKASDMYDSIRPQIYSGAITNGKQITTEQRLIMGEGLTNGLLKLLGDRTVGSGSIGIITENLTNLDVAINSFGDDVNHPDRIALVEQARKYWNIHKDTLRAGLGNNYNTYNKFSGMQTNYRTRQPSEQNKFYAPDPGFVKANGLKYGFEKEELGEISLIVDDIGEMFHRKHGYDPDNEYLEAAWERAATKRILEKGNLTVALPFGRGPSVNGYSLPLIGVPYPGLNEFEIPGTSRSIEEAPYESEEARADLLFSEFNRMNPKLSKVLITDFVQTNGAVPTSSQFLAMIPDIDPRGDIAREMRDQWDRDRAEAIELSNATTQYRPQGSR